MAKTKRKYKCNKYNNNQQTKTKVRGPCITIKIYYLSYKCRRVRVTSWCLSETHFMEGRWRSTTSTAWTGLVLIGLSSSSGSGILRPVSTSCNRCQLTRDTNLILTLKGRSLPPSPGSVTSRSTCGHTTRSSATIHHANLQNRPDIT